MTEVETAIRTEEQVATVEQLRADNAQARQEPTTGGPNRTPRSEIQPLAPLNKRIEPVLILDLSTSMDWGAEDEDDRSQDYPDPRSRRAIIIEALPALVRTLGALDSEAAAEQAGGSDAKGGLLTFGFSNGAVEIGDLNESNLRRVLNDIKWGGGTHIGDALDLAVEDYDGEFGDKTPDQRPTHLILIITDGKADDPARLEAFIKSARADRKIATAILGHGDKALATAQHYQAAADEQKAADKFGHSHTTVVNFDGVTDPEEIATDLIGLMV